MMNLELTSEHRAFQEQIQGFARDIVAPRAASIDKTGEYPSDVMHAAAGEGLCGLTIPKQWGGAGRDYLSYALAIEAIAAASATRGGGRLGANPLGGAGLAPPRRET